MGITSVIYSGTASDVVQKIINPMKLYARKF